ncbi:MAG: hypothetical protein KGM47_14065 [Acidobacteriota bacterium]|nr:hypothetical protein [Acidobacteriota bacterium]
MRFVAFSFGSIQIDDITYDHDIAIDRGPIRQNILIGIGLLFEIEPESTVGTVLAAESSQLFEVGNNASFRAHVAVANCADLTQWEVREWRYGFPRGRPLHV